jgi:hypothetical protein
MTLSSNQLFIVAVIGLAILAGAAYLDRTYLPVLVGVVIGVLGVFTNNNGSANGAAHIAQGVNLGVPLTPIASMPVAVPAQSEVIHAPVTQVVG